MTNSTTKTRKRRPSPSPVTASASSAASLREKTAASSSSWTSLSSAAAKIWKIFSFSTEEATSTSFETYEKKTFKIFQGEFVRLDLLTHKRSVNFTTVCKEWRAGRKGADVKLKVN